jgi:inorganic triphosphatase YgiF
MEIEAKLAIDDDRLWAKYRKCVRIGAYRLGAARVYSIVDEYLDTSEQHIRRAGFHLRVRSRGGERRVTIKSTQSMQMCFSVREEIEFPLHGDAEDVSNWVNREAAALMAPLLRGNALRPSVQLRQQRAERPVLRGGHTLATMGLDAVQVWHAGALLDDFRVLEFELVRAADMNVLDEISAVLAKDGLKPGPVAKLNRALAAVEVARKGTRDVA